MSAYGEPTAGTSSINSTTHIGSKAIRAILEMLKGTEIDTAPAYGATFVPKLKSSWHIASTKFFLDNPLGTFATYFDSAALLQNQKIIIPILENVVSSTKTDEPAFLKQTQTLLKKTIPISGTDLNIIQDLTANATHVATFDASGNLIKSLKSSLVPTIADNSITNAQLQQIIDKNKLPVTALYTTDSQEYTNKKYDIRLNDPSRMARIGAWTPDTQRGLGALEGCVQIGTDSGVTQNTGGKYKTLSTRAVANDAAGIVKLDSHAIWRSNNPVLKFAFLYQAAGIATKRIFKGVNGAQRLINLNSNTAPLNSGEPGFLFGYGAGDSVFSIFHNDASGTCVKDPTAVSLPGADANLILELQFSNSPSQITWILWNTTTGAKTTQAGTGIVNTDIPTATTGLYPQDLVVTTDGTIRSLTCHYWEVLA